jgi:hypothetical protein
MSKNFRVDFRDTTRTPLRITADGYERDSAQPTWFIFTKDGGVLDTRVSVGDVVQIVNEAEETPRDLPI